MENKFRLCSTQISDFINDFIQYSSMKDIKWFLNKYHITYEEYSYLSFAGLVAKQYNDECNSIKRHLKIKANSILNIVKKLNEVSDIIKSNSVRALAKELDLIRLKILLIDTEE